MWARVVLRMRASAYEHVVHKSTAVNIYRLKFLIVYNNTVIKSRLLKIKLIAPVRPLLNQGVPHFMYDFRLRGAARMATVCFPFGLWESP